MRINRNTFNNNKLQTSLIFRVFATNFAVGDLHASYERHFVKKIQHLFVDANGSLKSIED